MLRYTVENILEVFNVHFAHIVISAEFRFDGVERVTGHMPLIQRLHRVVTSHTAGCSSVAFLRGCSGLT